MKHLRSLFLVSVLAGSVFAVVSSCNTTEMPAESTDMATRTCCGKPGDVGKGMGQIAAYRLPATGTALGRPQAALPPLPGLETLQALVAGPDIAR